MLKSILFSLGITAVIASALGLVLSFASGINFWLGFAGTFLVQIIFFYALNTYLEQVSANRATRDAARIQANAIEATLGSQSINLDCAYCNVNNIVPVILAEENVFKCVACNQDNAVMMKFYAARVTNPLARRVETELSINGLPDEVKEVVEEREESLKAKEPK